jgi:calnexin
MMPDPDAVKPDDWDETEPEYIPDPEKIDPPAGWLPNEPKYVPDPNAVKSDDWDDDIHGEWEPPTISNPKCEEAPGCGEYEPPVIKNHAFKGKWRPPMIKNPLYKGVWKARQIPNPHYFEDKSPHNFEPIVGMGLELWMVNKEVGFTNIFIGTDEGSVHQWNKVNFVPKHKTQEAEQKKLEPEVPSKGLMESIKGFAASVKDAFTNLYNENAVMTIIFIGMIALIPILIICIACCRKSAPKPVPVATKKTEKPAQTNEKHEDNVDKDDPVEKTSNDEEPVHRKPTDKDEDK